MIHTRVKEKLTRRLGPNWTVGQIARRAGVTISNASMHLSCTENSHCTARHVQGVQDAIARAVGMSTGHLFGRHAWFRLAAKQLTTATHATRRAS